ncbi:MAG: rhodanese-like domain-containing protein [Ignavibacteriae bacterium]|jgi:thioredoxin 1|nr:MAG: rhodanese-like domain-containing protein [Ignavibacteriota bacterium]
MNLRLLAVLPFLLFAFTASSCGQTRKDIDPVEAKKMIDKGTVVLVDVRTPDEWNAGHLKNAKHIDINGQTFDQQLNKLDKSKTYVVYCAVGGRSSRAASIMAEKGFKLVYNMVGGYNKWSSMGYPTTTK